MHDTLTKPLQTPSDHIAKVIFEHAAVISRQSDLGTMVQLNADLARDLLGAERCSLWLLDEQAAQLWTRVAHGVSELRISSDTGLVGACLRSGEVILVNDVQNDPRFLRTIDLSVGFVSRSALCVPLHSDGSVMGVLQALNKYGGFTEEDAEILRFMGIYAASAIQAERLRTATEHARILRRELDVASGVQQRLLPQSSGSILGLECAGVCRPARTVGGDYFDFLDMRDGRFGITLGDVSGKGFPAAVLMASIHTLLRHLLHHSSAGLGELMAECNRTIHNSSASERYSTLFCGIFDSSRATLTYINAGQIPPKILRRDGSTIEELPGGDVPLGLLPEICYHPHHVSFRPGDLLVCVSDGIIEAENRQGEFWDPAQIDAVLLCHRHASAQQITLELISAVDEFSGPDNQFDDMTAIVIRVAAIDG